MAEIYFTMEDLEGFIGLSYHRQLILSRDHGIEIIKGHTDRNTGRVKGYTEKDGWKMIKAAGWELRVVDGETKLVHPKGLRGAP